MKYFTTFESPLGEMFLTATAEGLTGAYFNGQKYFPARNGDARESPRQECLVHINTIMDTLGPKANAAQSPPSKGDSGGCKPSNITESHCIPNCIETYLAAAKRQFEEYFENRRNQFELTLNPTGTPFQRRVWDALQTIPFGETTTYGALAATLGNPNATRAVAAAIGRNPISIIVPCHRVIGANGSLTGYAAGLDRKRALLELEGVLERDVKGGSKCNWRPSSGECKINKCWCCLKTKLSHLPGR